MEMHAVLLGLQWEIKMTRKLSTPFATNSTLINQVPVSQTSDSQASYDIGFPPKNFQTIANGGVAVDGKDFNGLLNDVTGNIVDLNKGLPQYYDDAYATLIGGYPVGARLCLNDNSDYVISTIANNTNNPNTNMTGWIRSKYFNSVAEMTSVSGSGIAITKSYYSGLGKGGAVYYYDSTQTSINNGVTVINGWVLQSPISVYRAGAYGDGKTDDTTYFQRAIDYSTYNKRNVDSDIMNNLLPSYTNISVENGNYFLSTYLKTNGNMVVWDTADNANFVGENGSNTKYLCGLVKRGDKITRIDNLGGIYDPATPLSIINNAGKERSAGLQGMPAPHLIQKYDGGEQVGIFVDTHVKSPYNITSDNITYTAIDTCTIKNVDPALYAKLTIGTPIITQHATAYKAQVKSIEYVDSTTLNITVWGFYLSNPNIPDDQASYDRVQPPAGFGAYFGYLKTAFGANITAWNENTETDSALCGIELDIYNNAKDENSVLELTNQPCSIGYYMANLGTKYTKFGFYGGWGNTRCMYMADSKNGQIDNGFIYRANADTYQQQTFFGAMDSNSNQLLRFSYNGMEFGDVSKSGLNVLDFHTSGNNIDYDARILVSGGSASIGTANFDFYAGVSTFNGALTASSVVTSGNGLANAPLKIGGSTTTFSFLDFRSAGSDVDFSARLSSSGSNGDVTLQAGSFSTICNILPYATNQYNLGSTSKTWANIYSQNAVTVVSDRNAKNSIQAIDDKVLQAWSEVEPKQYKLNGDDNWSFGYIAQDIVEAFERHGLDYKQYNLVHEEDGKFMLKYDMCAVLESALNRKRPL